ncbi:hypothetical protein BZG35_13710 [Brevundimonas sp. LM2]|uniref:hypothetical protein n=1 Tax=Brevundimonas sp. LM2 TaxID=1938605 RepID=UPI000983EBB5|nr:hypothetical protein [Brevundimonas sp. LM2]AQR62586.1 hypothetical protein BZG35_13710 [Brevundimonas sp. LM2]
MVGIIWLLMLLGFVPEVIQRGLSDAPPYPLIIHVHAVVYFGWLVFLALQVGLIRTRRVDWHMRMGLVGLALALAVILVGPAAGLTMQINGQARQPPQFLAIQFASVLGFTVMIAAGLMLRRHAAAHKRLMLIGTLALIGAGFGRVIRMVTAAPPPWTLIPAVYLAADVLLVAMAIHDLRTRGRLHPVFLPAAVVLLLTQLSAGLLLRSPAWIDFTTRLVN